MIWPQTFCVETDVTFFEFENGPSSTLLTSTIVRFIFHNHMIQGIMFYTFPCYSRGVQKLHWSILPYFPRSSNTSSRIHFTNGMLFPWILRKNLKKSQQLHLLTKRKIATATFWNGFAHNKLTRTGQINQNLPYWHCTPWKDLALITLHGFSQFSTSTLLMKLDLATTLLSAQATRKLFPPNM